MFAIEMVFAVFAMLLFIFGLYRICKEYYEYLPSRVYLCFGAIEILISALVAAFLPLAPLFILLWCLAAIAITGLVVGYCVIMMANPACPVR